MFGDFPPGGITVMMNRRRPEDNSMDILFYSNLVLPTDHFHRTYYSCCVARCVVSINCDRKLIF